MSGVEGVRIRPARASDLQRICDIVNHFIETTAFNFRTEQQSVQEWQQEWERLHRRYPWPVAIQDERVIGIAYAGPWKERNAYQWTVESTVYVDHESHRRGVGDALYDELLGRLAWQGFRSTMGVIGLPNSASVGLHERHGFVQVGQIADAGYKLGAWHDVGFWQRRLNDGPLTRTAPDPSGDE